MRKYSTNLYGLDWDIEYPDNVVFAYNPLYISLSTSPVNLKLIFSVTSNNVSRDIIVNTFAGKAQIYFSRILQLFFDDYKHFRTLNFTVSLTLADTTLFSTSFLAIWGSLPLGGRYNAYGLFRFTGKAEYERTRIWFKQFPFKVSMFSLNRNPAISCLSDGLPVVYSSLPPLPSGTPSDVNGEWVDGNGNICHYDASMERYYIADVGNGAEYGIFDVNPARIFPGARRSASLRIGEIGTSDVFDDSFDYTFHQRGLSTHVVNLKICMDTSGYYLRWIDSLGELQYFLFTKKIETEKNTLVSDKVSDREEVGPMWFPNHVRNIQITSKTTCKCSAVSLPREIYEYVSSIVTAPIIDLYLGKSVSGREIWVPVNIVAASYDYDTAKPLNDLTFSFSLPEYTSQTL